MSHINSQSNRSQSNRLSSIRWLWALLLFAGLLALPRSGAAQLDVCGCTGNPNSLGAFDTDNPATYPPGTVVTTKVGYWYYNQRYGIITIPLPPDGVLVFSSFTARPRSVDISEEGPDYPDEQGYRTTIKFLPNEANTPVTILVAGDVRIDGKVGIYVSGARATNGTSGINGKGGYGGPGGFPGADGAYQLVNFANRGGDGIGPDGGTGGIPSTTPRTYGANAGFQGSLDLLPLVGGSGGGGGASDSGASNCSGGGGGGGGGAILIAANGTITVNGAILADGGRGGANSNDACSSEGGGGSGGAIRLVANSIAGTGALYARGRSNVNVSEFQGNSGAIRMESVYNTMSATNTTPVAGRAPSPGALTNPVEPTVAITAVGGQPVTPPAMGMYGGVDVVLPTPGVTFIEFATKTVPSGTTVEVTVKPRVGAAPTVLTTSLTQCNSSGNCTGAVAVDLPAGAYTLEARATFQFP